MKEFNEAFNKRLNKDINIYHRNSKLIDTISILDIKH